MMVYQPQGYAGGQQVHRERHDDSESKDPVSRVFLDQSPDRPHHGHGGHRKAQEHRRDDEKISHGAQPITNPAGRPRTYPPVLLLVCRRAGVLGGHHEVQK